VYRNIAVQSTALTLSELVKKCVWLLHARHLCPTTVEKNAVTPHLPENPTAPLAQMQLHLFNTVFFVEKNLIFTRSLNIINSLTMNDPVHIGWHIYTLIN
jgi:hypothetical protein